MRQMIRTYIALAALVIAAPLSAQEQSDAGFSSDAILALKGLQLLDDRVNTIGYRLIAANAAFCEPKIAQTGLMLHDIDQYPDQALARFALGIDGRVAVNAVAPDSPAERAGLLVRDTILAINGQKIEDIALDDPALAKQPPEYRRIAAVNDQLDKALARGDVTLDILRGGEQRQLTVESRPACPSRFQISVSEDRSASANGEIVSISSAMAEYFLDDAEFAAVIAHELAHNLLQHRDRLDAQDVNRGFFGQFGKSAGRIKDTEIEADRLSVWLMANAGYDPDAAVRFWTRYGKEHGKGILSASTHYRWKKRVELFVEEIAKMAAMEPVDGKYPPPLLAGSD
ncbi:PDZ domain-containing protein [Parasphingorhabdus sp.]|uniref:PDZ domain-containing protein n=1 Tax=Parasphingorhabdus sp. TaxID=2709688 RepID=UPI0035931898